MTKRYKQPNKECATVRVRKTYFTVASLTKLFSITAKNIIKKIVFLL